ncbi:peptidoglycan-binding protein [Coleofasciculus sp. FACHB-1120]|uniref:peptidoglycan-binding domain-containing protein n=1 Tax=Coleofasciculus sp. FACHB-1120 TaxID=2692783 RepID=UPI001689C4DD|nr:peptidoglycan-binding protein [Coleofasciculus sp. FACHB-1120]MBD2741716.1 peptidoglycan-binding protein [Coleofasciculus sp. FACHB-1120]
METLAYLHLALIYEASTNSEFPLIWNSQKIFEGLNRQKLSSRASFYLLSLFVSLSVLGMSQAFAMLEPGNTGSEVATLQQRLQQLGYFKAGITGNFGPITTQAVIQFQKANGLEPDGIVGPQTEAALQKKRGRPNQAQVSQVRQVRQVNQRFQSFRQRPQRVSKASQVSQRPRSGVLQEGDRGPEVVALQQRLQKQGYFQAKITGYYGPLTKAAVNRFQQAAGMPVDGIVGSDTQAALLGVGGTEDRTPPKNIASSGQILQLGSNNREVVELQRRLRKLGILQGAMTGYFDQDTKDAVIQFQQAQGLTADGIARPNTILALKNTSDRFNTASSRQILQLGSNNREVVELQRRLRQLGILQGAMTGYFDQDTKDAVIQFQQAQGLTADGIARPNTILALKNTSDRFNVVSLQKRLKENGFYRGPLNGIFEAQTKAAVEAAQRAYGLSADDIVKGRF